MIKLIRPAFYHNKRNASYCALSTDSIPDYVKDGDEVYLIDEGIYTRYDATSGQLVPDESEGGGSVVNIVTEVAPTAITLVDNTEYYLSEVQTLVFTFPTATHWECWIKLTTVNSGVISITFPNTSLYIGEEPTFGNGETWEISIKDGVIVAAKVGV